ncbi:MAG: molybdate ABC transporter permease subunit [Bacteroidetes bacterium]|nr:MAG: molybdate ABC transporter permease subunit [Bacteroidota bacterium]
MDWLPFWLSIKLAFFTTLLLLGLGLPLVYVLHSYEFRLRSLLKAVVSLPLVLPPTVLGYYLLLAFQRDSWLGELSFALFDQSLAFSFPGLVLGSVIFSLPFMVNPVLSALEGLPPVYAEAAYTLGKSRWTTFRRVLLPNARAAVLVGIVMTFAHTLGEFGVILMIGGNIPGETRVASIEIYNQVEAMQYRYADRYAIILLMFSLLLLVLVYVFQGRSQARTL